MEGTSLHLCCYFMLSSPKELDMPKVVLEVPETEESISRPIASSISKQIVQRIGLDKSIRIVMPFEDLGVSNQNTTMYEGVQAPNRLNTQDQMEVVYEEEYSDFNQLTRPYVNIIDNKPIFIDDTLKISMHTNYQQIKGTLRCILRSTDFTRMQRWVKSIKNRVEREYVGNIHHVDYHYPIPLEALYMVCEMYNMRERNYGIGETLGQYLNKHFVKNTTKIVNPGGKNATWVIAENQLAITGWFDFGNIPPKPTKVDGAGAYTIEFTYNYIHDRCDDIILDYPFMVHNQHIPDFMFDRKVPYELDNYKATSNLSTTFMNDVFDYKVGVPDPNKILPGVPIPFYDTWYTPKTGSNHSDIMRLMLSVDEEDRTLIGEIDDVGDWYLKKNTVNYMKKVGEKVLKPYKSVVYVRLFSYDDLMSYKDLSIDSKLCVRFKPGLDPRKVYHLSVSLMADPTQLDPEGYKDLADNGCFTYDYLVKLFPRYQDIVPIPDKDCKIKERELIEFFDEIKKDTELANPPDVPNMFNQNYASIIGKKEKK